MAAEWYYTSNKQQMGPVSWEELQQLGTRGLLKPSDLVWTAGMGDWVKAQVQPGLLKAAEASSAVKVPSKAAVMSKEETFVPVEESADDAPKSRKKRKLDLDDADEDEDRPRRRKTSAGNNSSMTYLLIGGGIIAFILLIGCGGVVVYMIGSNAGPDGVRVGANGQTTLTFNNIRAKAFVEQVVQLQAGKECDLVLTSRTTMARTDVDIFVFDGDIGNLMIVSDVTIGPNGRVVFRAPQSKGYRVRIVNHGPGNASSTVVVTQR